MKIGILIVATNEKYWQYLTPMVESAKKYLLPDHHKEFLLWTDSQEDYGCTRFEADDMGFPWATLMRYHLFLKQEEYLRKFDFLLYVDVDMLFVDTVGDEILGEHLTGTEHPGYSRQAMFHPPYEPNVESTAYIPYSKHYFAGGFQGGKTEDFIKAMWSMKRAIDEDLNTNYIARWHDESHWNKYLWDNPPSVVLSPAYCYPVVYPVPDKPPYPCPPIYKAIWGCNYEPKLMCLTKPWHLTKEGGQAIKTATDSLEALL